MPKPVRLLAAGLLALLASGSLAGYAAAQVGVQITQQSLEYQFNQQLAFSATFDTDFIIEEAYVFYQWPGSDRAWVYQGDLQGNDRVTTNVTLEGSNTPQPFTQVTYWYRFATDHGDIYESQQFSFYYDDNRYEWQHVEDAPFTLYWHSGDAGFATSVLVAARQGVQRTQALLPLSPPTSALLRVYDDPADVQLIANQSGFAWQAGHTDPAAGTILLSLAPGPQQSLEVQRQVPHEVAHLMLYQSLGAEAYARLPAWLNEGIASNAETYRDPLAAALLDVANTQDGLLPIFSLCQAFPQDEASARLAYAEAASFVGYLHTQYNSAGLSLLVNAYANSGDCLNASLNDFGRDLNSLDAEWRAATFKQDQGWLGWLRLAPWQAILGSAAVALAIFLVVRISVRIRKS